jgi:NAD-dependent deacetylase
VHYVAPFVPKFILDKHIPETSYLRNLTVIEKPATEGVKDLRRMLMEMK